MVPCSWRATRFSIVTYNLWNTQRWAQRADAVARFLELYHPDVLCVQELAPESRAFIDARLDTHARVDDDFVGWVSESNIWWRSDLFDCSEHGAEPFGCVEYPDRRVFWVRLRPIDRDISMVVATVHLTDFGTAHEIETGESPRVREGGAVVEVLQRVVAEDEAAVLVGDFNDAMGPIVPLFVAGYISCFGALDQIPPATLPSNLDRFGGGGFASAFVLDWILANRGLRAMTAASPHIYVNDTPPSDHWPVQATYELQSPVHRGSPSLGF